MGNRKITLANYGEVADTLHTKKVAEIELSSIIINNPFNIRCGDKLQLCMEEGKLSFMVRVTKATDTTIQCVPAAQ
jgi:hypothetical protein